MQSYAECSCQEIFDRERKIYYKLSCEAKKTTGKANGETVSENDCYKVKKNV